MMNEINERIIEEAKRNGVNDVQPAERACGTTLSRAINAIRRKHNSKRVVLLVDEFDGPLTAVLEGNGGETDERVRENLSVLRGLYNGCKALAAEGQFYYSMYAGLTTFGATALFSGFNQVKHMSYAESLAAVAGFTEQEVNASFPGHLALLLRNGTTLGDLSKECGGYRFSSADVSVLCPRALLNRLDDACDRRSGEDEWNAMTPEWLQKLLGHPEEDARLAKSVRPEEGGRCKHAEAFRSHQSLLAAADWFPDHQERDPNRW